MKKFATLSLILMTGMLWMTATTEANFIQCVVFVNCDGTVNNDVLNGTPEDDFFDANIGDDLLFGGDGQDYLGGNLGDDILFGGPGSDLLDANLGDDLMIPGPDQFDDDQFSSGSVGNDSFYVFAGETINCQTLAGNGEFDVVNLIGFGPYTAIYPFGMEITEYFSSVVVQDPIAGGYIFITVGPIDDTTEVINGLPSPNVTVLNAADSQAMFNEVCQFII